MGLPTGVDRLYSLLEIKDIDAEKRVITGVATTPSTDRVGDIVEPLGVTFKNPVPLLLYHDKTRPVGTVRFDKPTKDGLTFTATIAKIENPPSLRDRVDEAWESVKQKLLRGVSIGFRPLNDAVDFMQDTGGFRFRETEVLELSLVTVPAHQAATIQTIKSLDIGRPDATADVDPQNTPAGVGTRGVRIHERSRSSMKKTTQEQIKDLEATRASYVSELNEIQTKATDEGRAKEVGEKDKFDELKSKINVIDDELKDLRELEAINIASATEVTREKSKESSDIRGGTDARHTVTVEHKLPPGMGFARAVKCKLVARLDGKDPLAVAKSMYPSDTRLHAHLAHEQNIPNIISMIKAAVSAATTTNSVWAGALADPTNLPGEFVEYLRPMTIIGRLNLRSVPTNVRLIEQTTGGTGYWVGQGAPKPLTAFEFAPITLGPTKVAAIAVATEESLRYSSPSLDGLIRDGLRDALVERVDRDLLDPAEAGTANIQPASLTNGVTPLTSAGTSSDNIRTDMANLIQTLRSQNLRGPIAIVLPDSLLTAMAWMVNSLGQPEFPGLTGEGGTFNGLRFIGSEYVANQSGSGNMVVAIAEREVFRSDDGGVRVDASREASLEMLTNPTNNSATPTPTTQVSMWQTNSVAFRGEWFINWQKRRSTAVAFLDDVNWGSIGSP